MNKLAVISTVAAVALAVVAVAVAAPERRFSLGPMNGSKAGGTGTLRSLGSETALTLKLHGLPANKKFRTVMGSGTCAQRSGPFAPLGGGTSRPDGRAVTSSLVRFKGVPQPFKKIADGKHIVLIFRVAKAVACGLIPA